jgi:hypothetical protein
MKKFLRLVLFGFLSWIVTFGASICLFGLKKENEHTFEIIMGMVLTLCTVGFTLLYFRKIRTAFFREGVLLGLAFVACNILFDLPMFLAGPMRMPPERYFAEIGIAYFSMAIISIGVGCALRRCVLKPAQSFT